MLIDAPSLVLGFTLGLLTIMVAMFALHYWGRYRRRARARRRYGS